MRTLSLSVLLLLVGCSSSSDETPEGSADAVAVPLPEPRSSLDEGPAPATSPEAPSRTGVAPEAWAGSYAFTESAPALSGDRALAWSYLLTLDADGVGTLDIDGYQTLARYNVRADARNDGGIDVIVTGYGTDHRFSSLPLGETLLSLSRASGGRSIATTWAALQPQAAEATQGSVTAFSETDPTR